ncbi:MAG: hypothetical protein J0L99_02055 [Chitinophagales bacterium]|nr:hypothetical protein [Chitinophagales bacterium]
MRKKVFFMFSLLFVATLSLVTPACKTKSGCPANESLKPKTTKSGSFKKGKSQSGLFPKKMQKKMK